MNSAYRSIYITIFIAYAHGAIGVSYSYPLVNIKYTINEKIQELQNVFILENDGKRIVILDRLNYMKIIEMPYSNIKSITQKAKIFLFKNCSQKKGDIKLCEEFFSL